MMSRDIRLPQGKRLIDDAEVTEHCLRTCPPSGHTLKTCVINDLVVMTVPAVTLSKTSAMHKEAVARSI